MNIKIVKSKNDLRVESESVSMDEGTKIASTLIDVINKNKKNGCYGLTAKQIGINKSVCVIDVREPKIFINPSFSSTEETDKRLIYREVNISFPNKIFQTLRYKNISVKADNYANNIIFGPDNDKSNDKGWTKNEYWGDIGIMECSYIQHMIHLINGKFPSDIEFVHTSQPQVNSGSKYGRNDKVMVQKGSLNQYIKYKHAIPLLEDGWVIV